MAPRRATDAEVGTWKEHGWVLLEGLVGTEEIDGALEDLHRLFPTAEEFHADPDAALRKWGRGASPVRS